MDAAAVWWLKRMNLWEKPVERPLLEAPPVPALDIPAAPLEFIPVAPSPAPPPPVPKPYAVWAREMEQTQANLEIRRAIGAALSYQPKISVLTPIYHVPNAVLSETIRSIVNQTYANWELCLAHGEPANQEQREYLARISAEDPRIKVTLLSANEGISGNSNHALALATGDFVALLDHDDTLAPFALLAVVELLNRDPSANFIYTDKDQISEDGLERMQPFFKPVWSPEVMLSANYLTHLCVMRTAHVREVGGFRTKTDGAQDWDLFLRVIARYGNVRHIPQVLYHWRRISSSVASGGLQVKPYAADAQVVAVADYCEAVGLPAHAAFQHPELRVSWPLQKPCKVSVIYLASGSAPEAFAAAEKLVALTSFPDMEVLVPTWNCGSAGIIRGVPVFETAGLIERVESAVAYSTGDVLAFVDETVTPTGPGWLYELVGPLQHDAIGLTGAKLVDPRTHLLRHTGIVFNEDGGLEYIYAGYPEHVNEEFGPACWYRDWSAVSGACFAVRRETWYSAGGLNGNLVHPRPDVHLCLKIGFECGKRIVYTPFARFHQEQSAALEKACYQDDTGAARFIRSCFPGGDPYFSPNLTCKDGKILLKSAPMIPPAGGADYAADSRAFVQIYDFSPELVARSREACSGPPTGRLRRMTWLLPEFDNSFYGGVHTILRFASAFRKHSVRPQFCVIGHGLPARYRRQIAAAFPELADECDVVVLDNHTRTSELPPTDAAISSLWTTAYAALHFDGARRKFYFIQDDEALFYPAGSSSALAVATYGFGFLGICNTSSLLKQYRARGGEGEYFTPSIDPSVFHAAGRKPIARKGPYTLFCYGRPGHARNCFELLTAVMRGLKERFGDELTILNAGARWDLKAYGLEGVVENLGLLSYESTGALYRTCDAGLVMMMTRHPSYLPMELMACGSLVITNHNPDNAWLLKDEENCLLAQPATSTFIARVEEGLRNSSLRCRLTTAAHNMVKDRYSDWDRETEKIYRYILSQC